MTLTPDQKTICDAIRDYQKVAVMASHSVGKCLAPDAWLSTQHERVQAKDLVDSEFSMLTLTEDGALAYAPARASWNCVEPIFTLRLVSGAEIARNGRHPVWAGYWSKEERTIRPHGWVALQDVQSGDFVATPAALPHGDQQGPRAFLYMAGALYGDDRAHVTLPAWSMIDDSDHLEHLRALAQAEGALLHYREYGHQAARLMARETLRDGKALAPFMAWLKAEGAPSGDEAATDFGLPHAVWGLDRAHLAGFLEAAFRQGGGNPEARARLRSRSPRCLREFQELLLRFGVQSVVGKGSITTSSCRNVRDLLGILIGGQVEPSPDAGLYRYAPPHMVWTLADTITEHATARTVALEVPSTGTFVTTVYEHNTYIMAGLTLWRYVCFEDAKVITTAPGEDSVKDLLWGLIRKFWEPRPGLMPSAPELHNPDRPRMSHYAVGRVAAKGEGFQGRHDENLMIIFDEAVGIERQFWLAANNMCTDPNNRWAAIFNPTDISSAAYAATLDPKWHVITISALQHPNVLADLAGQPRPYPGAASAQWVEETIEADSTPLDAADIDPTRDIEWPPGSGKFWRPGFDTETRVLGRWPSQSSGALWSEQMWSLTMLRQELASFEPIIMGCDVAAGGENDTVIVVRKGACALHAESHNGWDTGRTAARLRQLCEEYGERYHQAPETMQVNIDETGGYGKGVIDQSFGYSFVGVHSSATALDAASFPNRRSELWFTTANLAKLGALDFTRLDPLFLLKLRGNFMAVRWEVNPINQQRVVEPKKKTIQRIKASPDQADAINLAFSGGAVLLPILPMLPLSGGWSRR